jgi:hypothetical protein
MKRHSVLAVVLLLCLLIGAPAAMAQAKGAAPKGNFPPAAIKLGDDVIKPGEKLATIWALLGPADKIWAMRNKKDEKEDYVKLDYFTYGFSLDVVNTTNLVKGILVEENNNSVKLVNCPFRVGQDALAVTTAWGEPEKKISGTMAYWSRGVFVGVNEAGKITHMFITSPGKYKD